MNKKDDKKRVNDVSMVQPISPSQKNGNGRAHQVPDRDDDHRILYVKRV